MEYDMDCGIVWNRSNMDEPLGKEEMNLGTIKLPDPLYCNGCPCRIELFFQSHCLYFHRELPLDMETTERKSFMKSLRPEICIKENGI